MIYLVHKQSRATLQLPKGWKKIRALQESFYQCEEVSYSMYLHQVKQNELLQHQRFTREIEQTPSGYFWHAKYLPPRQSVIGEVEHVLSKRDRERARQRKKYRRNHPEIRRNSRYLELKQTHPGSMETLSGGE